MRLFHLFFFILIVSLTGCNSSEQSNSKGQQDTTSTNISQDSVSIELAKYAAQEYAKRYYGELHYFTHFLYYDLDDKPATYAIVYTKPGVNDKNVAEVDTDISKWYEETVRLKQELEVYKPDTQTGKSPDIEKYRQLKSKFYEAVDHMRGRDEFMTIVVGATREYEPIIQSYRGLPHHWYQPPLVSKKLENDSVHIGYQLAEKVYFVSDIEQFYSVRPASSSSSSYKRTSSTLKILRIGGGIQDREDILINKQSRRVQKKSDTNSFEQKWLEIETLYKQSEIIQ